MATLDTLNPLVTLVVTLQKSQTLPSSLGFIIVSEHTRWVDRLRRFTVSSPAALLALLTDAGMSDADAEYHATYYWTQQTTKPGYVYMGRKDPTDADWAAALNAMRADPTYGKAWWGGVAITRDDAEQREIIDWQKLQTTGGWIFATPSTDVRDQVVGNLAEYSADQAVPTCAILYHDPATATDAAAPTATTSAGPWALTPGGALSAIADGGTPEPYILDAEPAVVTSTIAGPYAGADGQVLAGSVDGVTFAIELDASPATATAVAAVTYDLAAAVGNDIFVESDSGTDSYALGSGAAFGVPAAATAAEIAADFVAAVNVAVATAGTAGTAPTFSSITAGTAGRFRFATGTDATFLSALGLTAGVWYAGTGNVGDILAYTASEVATLIQADIGIAGTAEQVDEGGADDDKLRLTSATVGTAGNVTITSGTAGLLAAIGLTVASTDGTGDVADADAVTPLELFPLLDAAWSADFALTLTDDNTTVTTTGTLGVGRWHTLRFVGELRSQLGLPAGVIRGTGTDDDYADACWAAQLLGRDLDTPPPVGGLINADNRALIGCTGDVFAGAVGQAKSQSLREDADVNTLEQWTASRVGPETHSGRCAWRLGDEPVYFETLIAKDWLAIRLQEAFKAMLDKASDSNSPIPYTTKKVRAAVTSALSPVLRLAVQVGIIAEADLTQPDPSTGKETGFEVLAIEASTAMDRALRRARVRIKQQLAGALQQGYIDLTLINA